MPTQHRAGASPLIARLPFFYGWVILGCVCCAAVARQGPAVATLSIFVEPMTGDFGWSRTALSGAVSLGGVMAAVLSPLIGPMLDRRGARMMLCSAVLVTGACTMALSLTQSLLAFYVFFCIARMNFAGPFDIGIYGALNTWFVERRPLANAIVNLAHMAGLAAVPLIAYAAMAEHGWRAGWLAVGVTVLLVGFVPCWLFLVRRPEDVGLVPDGRPPAPAVVTAEERAAAGGARAEPVFTRAEAMRTSAFWLLALYTMVVYPVQAGVSLHQAPHLIERGLSAATAATIVSVFSLSAGFGGVAFGLTDRRIGVRAGLALAAALAAAGTLMMLAIAAPLTGYVAAACFGAGLGGVFTILPLAWADYFGRNSFGAIRGAALTMQVTAQAAGPLLSGYLRDLTGDYTASLAFFAALSGLGVLLALLARAPRRPAPAPGPASS
jgi:MFS transporter, OFA family, oxalate/formate antiporter